MSRTALSLLFVALSPIAAWAEPPVEIIAHRGASHDAPENTVTALKLAWEQQADGSEFDVWMTKDGKIVAMHDKDTKRTTGVNKLVSQSTYEELQSLDAGEWKDARFAGEKIPTLAEMLAHVPAGKRVFVEVKCGPEIVPGLTRSLKESKLPPDQTPVICFNADVVASLKKARPDIPAYWLVSLDKKGETPPTAQQLIAKANQIGADGLDLSATKSLDPKLAKQIKAAGLKLYVWTVNDVDVARRMAECGVDGITTDRPAWLRENLGLEATLSR